MKNSVLIIGIDGATWKLLKPWIENGELPALKKLLNEGAGGNLKTVIPALSCTAWTSLFTGTNPGKHGIFEYLTDSGKLVNSTSIKSEKIWRILSFHNKRCCIINVPVTYPAEEINGYMVPSLLTPTNEKIYSYPHNLMPLLKKYGYRINIKNEGYAFLPDKESVSEKKEFYLRELYDVLEKRYSTLKQLMDEPWDFFMLVFNETSILQYLFWDKKEVILEFFKKVDAYIDDLIKTFSKMNDNPYIFIVSDHGFNAAPRRRFNFRPWMDQNGFIRDDRNLFQKAIPKIYKTLNKTPFPKLVFRFNKPREIRNSFQRKLTESPAIYFRKGLFIDKSKLKDNEYDKLRDELITKVRQIKDPLTNEGIFQVVEKREAIYSGNNLKYAPDIVLATKENYDIDFLYDSDKVFDDIKLNMPGRHLSDLYGIFLGYGDEINNNISLENLSILDIFPTVLHILGAPIPKDVDGRVLTEIFKKDSYLFNKEIAYSEESTKILKEKSNIQAALQDIEL